MLPRSVQLRDRQRNKAGSVRVHEDDSGSAAALRRLRNGRGGAARDPRPNGHLLVPVARRHDHHLVVHRRRKRIPADGHPLADAAANPGGDTPATGPTGANGITTTR